MTVRLDDEWQKVQECGVILVGAYNGHPYAQEDFKAGLESAIEKVSENVLSFGPSIKNNQWHMTLKSVEMKDRLLVGGSVTAKGSVLRQIR